MLIKDKLATIDTVSTKTVDLDFENEFDIGTVSRTDDEIIYLSIPNQEQSGKKKIMSKRILNWSDRMRKLRDLGHMKEAIKLAISFYNGTAIAIVGAGDNKDIFHENVKEAISLLSFKYMKKILNYISQGSMDLLTRSTSVIK